MAASKHFPVLVCAALLALGACTDTKHVTDRVPKWSWRTFATC